MTGKTIDFDAFRKEQAAEPVRITIGGKSYDLATSLPATLALDVVRMREVADDESKVQPEDLMRVGAGLFGGDDAFRAILADAKVTLDELPDLIKFVMDEYTKGVTPEADPGKPAAQA